MALAACAGDSRSGADTAEGQVGRTAVAERGAGAREAAPTTATPATLPPDTIAPLAPPGAPASAFPEPDRPVAEIVSDHWSSEGARDRAGEAQRVMELLGVREGMRVADIGAGSGYHTVRLARRVGPEGVVYAEDIVRRYLEGLRERVRREELENVRLVLGDPHDPRLPAGSVDVALMVHMYHEVEQPYGLLYNLVPALRAGARVAILDLDRPTPRHGTPPALLRCELEAVGYRRTAFHRLAEGYLAVFDPPVTSDGLTAPDRIQACAVE